MDNLKCQEMYNKYNEENKKNIKILDQQVCAGHTEGKIDGCQVSWAISVKKVLIDEYLFAPHTLLVSFVLYFFCYIGDRFIFAYVRIRTEDPWCWKQLQPNVLQPLPLPAFFDENFAMRVVIC